MTVPSLVRAAIVIAATAVLLSSGLPAQAGQEKVDVCHITDTATVNGVPDTPIGHVINIALPAYKAHIDHGDPEQWMIVVLDDGREVCTPVQCDFPDPLVRSAIEHEIGHPAPFTAGELESIEYLQIAGYVTEITGVQCLTNLRQFSLYPYGDVDLRPLAGLQNLELLYIMYHGITDISPLAGIDSLSRITFHFGPLSDISPLAEKENLQYLSLYMNQVEDLSPLLGAFPDDGTPDRVVDVRKNPAVEPPISGTTQAILDELAARGIVLYY